MADKYPRVQFRIDEDLQKKLQERSIDGNIDATARRDLIRAYAVMDSMREGEFDFIAKNILREREDESEREARRARLDKNIESIKSKMNE